MFPINMYVCLFYEKRKRAQYNIYKLHKLHYNINKLIKSKKKKEQGHKTFTFRNSKRNL